MNNNVPIIIAVDAGNGNIKTENTFIKSGLEHYRAEPSVSTEYMRIDDDYYVIGEGHVTYQGDKTSSEDNRILTLAGIVRELAFRGIESARIHLAVGLPLGWCSRQQKDELSAYLMRDPIVDIIYKGSTYHIDILSVSVYPQGFAAVCGRYSMRGINMIADLGNGTLNLMQIIDGKPIESSVITERIGVDSCMREIQKELSRVYSDDVPESLIEPYLINGCSGSETAIANVVKRIATDYCDEIWKKLVSSGYKAGLMRLYVIGGGGQILRHYSCRPLQEEGIVVLDDICANAKGYAYLERQRMKMSEG